MNAGAAAAAGAALLFLHADTRLPPDADQLIFRRWRRIHGEIRCGIESAPPLACASWRFA
jgi:hypothetical protein